MDLDIMMDSVNLDLSSFMLVLFHMEELEKRERYKTRFGVVGGDPDRWHFQNSYNNYIDND